MNKMLLSKKLGSNLLLLLFSLQLHSQCPLSFPQSNDWGSWNRLIYDGNWLLNSAGTAYVSTPVRSALSPTTSNTIDFGVNDYIGDLNFSSLAPPLSGSPIIRIGKKFNQPGQGLLSPVRRAAVTTFTFTPTQQNCKIKVYYIGMLQEPSSTATYYSAVVKSFRMNTASQPASFGLFCRYDYNSSIPNVYTSSHAGSTEFGTVEATSSSTFVNSASNINYGLNDMFSFYQAGTTIKQLPTTNGINKTMTAWDNYVMDFSEFIGTPVTITLFANTSNYAGSTQNHSYCYYQFECLNDAPTTLPDSTLSISTDINTPTIFDLNCLNDLPTTTPINITNVNPTLLGNLSNATAVNNNTALSWLNIIKPLPTASTIYNSNFASVSVDLKDSGGNWNSFAGVTGGADINVAIKTAQPTLATAIVNGFNYEFDFRIHYKNWRNTTEQIGYFKVKATVLSPVICNDAPQSITVIDPNSVLTPYDATNYFICKPQNSSTQDNVTLNLGASNCTPVAPTTFIGYQWQRSSNGGASWANIGTPSLTALSLVNAQNQVYYNACSTLFRRVNVTSISCTNSVIATSDTDQEIAIWNNGYAPFTASPTLIIHDYITPSNINTLPNVVLGTKVVLCYGEKVDFTTTLKVGNASCTPPVISGSSNTVSAQLTYLSSTGTTVTLASIANQPLLSGLTSITLPQFSYEAINGNGFTFTGASASVQIPITITVTTTINGCSLTTSKTFINLKIFPRAVGGAILNPICPLMVSNDPNTPTVAYDANEGNSSLPPNGYDWSYCTNYTTVSPGNYNCNSTWTAIAGQGDVNLPLWTTAVLGVQRPFILKRTAKSGNNCGGAEDSNTILIDSATIPNFNLPSTLCLSASSNAMPVASPVVNGTWYEITGTTPPAISTASITDLSSATIGAHSYVFIPATPDQNNNVCYDFVVWNVTILNAIPVFTQVAPICSGSTLTPLPTVSNNGITGIWSPAQLDNMNTATYTFTPTTTPGTCTTPVSMTITVNPKPVLTGDSNLCIGSSMDVTPATGGVWSSSSTPRATVTNAGHVTAGTTAGAVTLTFKDTATGCSATKSITVTAKVTPTFASIPAICNGDTAPTLPLTSTNGITGTWSPLQVSNTATTTYTFSPDAGQCANNGSLKVIVTAKVTPTFASIPAICSGDTAPTLPLTSTNGITGTWSPSIISNTTIGTTTYYFTPNNGQCANPKTINVTVKALPAISGANSVCMGSTAIVAPTTGTWSSLNPAIATINGTTVTPVSAGTATLSFTSTTSACTNTKSITVNDRITPTFTFSTSPICKGTTAPILPTTSSNGVIGTWSPSTVSNTAVGITNYVFSPATNQCAVGITVPITVLPGGGTLATLNDSYAYGYLQTATTTGSVLANDSLNGTPITATTPDITVALTGTLPTFSNGGITLNSDGTFTILPFTTPGTYTYTYMLNYPCATSVYGTAIISLTTLCPQFNFIDPICQDTPAPSLPTNPINIPSLTGTWSPATIDTTTAGTFTYTFTPTTGQSTTATGSVTVTILPAPSAATISGVTTIYGTGTTTLTPSIAGGTWTSNNSNIATVNYNGIVTGISAGTTTINYTVTNSNGCTATVSSAVNVITSPIPFISQTYFNGNDQYVEIKNPSYTIAIPASTYFLALYQDGATVTNAPTSSLPIPVLNPQEVVVFRSPLATAPVYATTATNVLDASFNCDGSNDVLVISTNNTSLCYNNRVDMMGDSSSWGATTSLVRTNCATSYPRIDLFDPEDWVVFTLNEMNSSAFDSTSKTNAVLGRHNDDNLVFGTTGWADNSTDQSNPDRSRETIIATNYNTTNGGSFEACSLNVLQNKILTITANDFVSVQTTINVDDNGAINVKNNGALVQVKDQFHGVVGTNLITLNNSNNINIERTTVGLNAVTDYVYWASPLTNDSGNLPANSVNNLFPSSLFNSSRFFEFRNANFLDSDGNGYDDNLDDYHVLTTTQRTGLLTPGLGYTTWAPIGCNNPISCKYTVTFNGKPNNGEVTVPVYHNDPSIEHSNLVGNPYPSAINLNKLFEVNAGLIDPVAFIWGRTLINPDDTPYTTNPGPDLFNYNQASYIVYSPTMIINSNNTFNADGILASCQSFFVNTTSHGGNLVFNNSMRTNAPNNTFAKTSTNNSGDKLWLSLSHDKLKTQIGIAFLDKATDAYNRKEDVKALVGRTLNFYTKTTNEDLIIDAQNTFNENKTIPFGITSLKNDNQDYTISIDKTSGTLKNQTIYLEDKLLGIVHELSNAPYTFKLNENVVDNRFVLKFINEKSSTINSPNNDVAIIANKEGVSINSLNKNIKLVSIIDIYTPAISGLEIDKSENINSKQITICIDEKYKLLFVKVILEDGTVVTKKIMR